MSADTLERKQVLHVDTHFQYFGALKSLLDERLDLGVQSVGDLREANELVGKCSYDYVLYDPIDFDPGQLVQLLNEWELRNNGVMAVAFTALLESDEVDRQIILEIGRPQDPIIYKLDPGAINKILGLLSGNRIEDGNGDTII